MIALMYFVLAVLAAPVKSRSRLEAENAALRHQLIFLQRKVHGRIPLTNNDRWFFIQLYRWFPSILTVLTIIRPETLVRWHRAGFRCYWRWKSRRLGGRPQIETDLRALIRRMSADNPLWGAPRIHGELLKLGFEVAQSSVAKYMVRRHGPPSQGWRTFLRNHAPDIAAMDLFVVPTIGFDLLYAFVIVRLDRRNLVWINVTANPTAESGSHLWHRRYTPIARHGHPRQTYCAGFALAERLCRTADRVDPARVYGSSYRLERGTSAPDSAILCSLLQRHQNAPVTEQGFAGLPLSSADWKHEITPDPWCTSSPFRPGIGFWYTQAAKHAICVGTAEAE
jgi:hypothetical protein